MGWGSTLASVAGLVLALPLLALLSLLLLPLAILTTGFAAFALSFRALFIYVELAIGVATDWVTGRKALPARAPTSSSPAFGRSKSIRSVSSVGSHTAMQSQMTLVTAPIYASNPFARDYEGIGGWRVAADEDDDNDAQWLTMNSRLELPAVSAVAPEERRRHHSRRATSSSMPGSTAENRKSGSSSGSGGVVRSRPVSMLQSSSGSGRTSPVTTVDGQGRVKSMVQMGETLSGTGRGKVGKRKSSTSSSGSERTLVI
jgi:hypothetical protein